MVPFDREGWSFGIALISGALTWLFFEAFKRTRKARDQCLLSITAVRAGFTRDWCGLRGGLRWRSSVLWFQPEEKVEDLNT